MDRFSTVRAFVRVVDTGSFTKAADALELPRNTVTKMVQSLEAHLQVKLLNRTTRSVSVTNDGAAYYDRMARILEEWEQTDADLAVAQSRPRGRLRVDIASLLATQIVIPALPSFYARYPDLQLDIGVGDRSVDLARGRIDCVVRAGGGGDPSLIARHLCDLPLVLCASEAYLARCGRPESPSDLEQGHQLVRYFFAGSGRKMPLTLKSGEQQVSVQGKYVVSVNDANAMLAAGLAGLGIIHIPALAVQSHIDDGKLVPVLEGWSTEIVPLSLIYSPNRHLSTRLRVFADWLIETLGPNRATILSAKLSG